MKVPVYILAGGKSRRFGSDKARALSGAVPQVVQLAELVAPLATAVTIVAARDGAYEDLGLRTIGDLKPELGPIGGLLTALEDHGGEGWLLLLACDWVGLSEESLVGLLEASSEAHNVICYKTERYEPLLTLYHSSVRDAVSARIADGDLAMHRLLNDLDVHALPRPAGWERVTNLNTPPTT